MDPDQPSPEKPAGKPDPLKPYLKYSGMAVQMIGVLVLAAWGGRKLDAATGQKYPVFTIVLMLVGVVAAMVLVVSSVMKDK
jgi:F0F1-type ATP synthase assembly protein I